MTGGHLLVVWQPRPGSIEALRDAVLAGIDAAAPGFTVRSRSAPDADPTDLDGAVGVVVVTSEHFGAVAGLVKDFLERIYPWFEEVPDVRPGLPYLLIAKGGTDGTGAVRDVTRILTGLRWRPALAPVVIAGPLADHHVAQVHEAAATLAAGIDTGVF